MHEINKQIDDDITLVSVTVRASLTSLASCFGDGACLFDLFGFLLRFVIIRFVIINIFSPSCGGTPLVCHCARFTRVGSRSYA